MVFLLKKPSNERGFVDLISLFTLVVLVVGLVSGTILVAKRQELRKFAALPEEEGGPPPEEIVPPPPGEQPPQPPPEQPPEHPPPSEQRECTASDCGCEAGFRCVGTTPNCSCEAEHAPYCADSLTSGPDKCPYGCNPSPQGGYCNPPPPPPPPPPAQTCNTGDCFHDCTVCQGNGSGECSVICGIVPSPVPPTPPPPAAAPQPTQTPIAALPGDYQSWRCPGPNCDKCGYAGWWVSGCSEFVVTHPGDAPYASQRFSGGILTSCGSVSKQCSSPGEAKCGADTGYKEATCGNDGCYHETGGSCQPIGEIQPPVTAHCGDATCSIGESCLTCPADCGVCPSGGPCKLDEIQINCPNGEKVCQNLITGQPQCVAHAPAPSACAKCLAGARDPYDCASECNLSVVSKVGYDPTAFTLLIDENQRLKDLGLVKETILPKDFKPYDPSDSELVKKYGTGSLEDINCLVGGPGLGAKGGCEPEALYLRDKYGVDKANRIIITKEAYKKTADLGCGDLFNIWGEKCKDAFQAYTAAGFKAKDNEGANTVAGLGTAFIAGLMGGPPGAVLFGTSDFLFSKTRLDEQESAKTLLEDRYGKGVIDVNFPSFLGSAATLAQRAGVDTSSLGSVSRVDTLYRAYNSLIESPFIIKPVPSSFDPREVTDPNEQARIIQEINKILTPSAGAGRVPAPFLRQPKEQIKNWDEVISLSNIRSGLIVYKDSALSSGYGQVYQQKNDEFKRELTTNLALDAATAGVGHVVGQAVKGGVKGAEETAVKKVVDDLAEKRLLSVTEGLTSEAEKLNAIKRLISDAKVKGGEVVLEKGERLEANDVLLQTKFEQGLLSSSDIKGIILSGDEAAASVLVKDAKEVAGLSLDQLRSDALASRAVENVDTKTLLKGRNEAGDVANTVEVAKLKPPVVEVSKPPPPSVQSFLDKARELFSGERGALTLRTSEGADYLASQAPSVGASSDRLLSVYDDVAKALERQRPAIEGGLSPNYDELIAPAAQRIRVVYPKNSEAILAEIKKAAKVDANLIRAQAIRREQAKIISQTISSIDETQSGINQLLKDQALFMDRVPLNRNTQTLFSDIRQIIADIDRNSQRLATAKTELRLLEAGTTKEPTSAIGTTLNDLDNAIRKLKARQAQLTPLVGEGGPLQAGLRASETQSRALETLEKTLAKVKDTPALFIQRENEVGQLNRTVVAITGRPASVLVGFGPAQLFEDISNATIYRVLPEARTEGIIPSVINRLRGGPKPPLSPVEPPSGAIPPIKQGLTEKIISNLGLSGYDIGSSPGLPTKTVRLINALSKVPISIEISYRMYKATYYPLLKNVCDYVSIYVNVKGFCLQPAPKEADAFSFLTRVIADQTSYVFSGQGQKDFKDFIYMLSGLSRQGGPPATPTPLSTPLGTIPPYVYVPAPTPPPGVFSTPPPTPQVDTILVAFPEGNYNFFLTADDLRKSIQKDIKEGKVQTGQLVWVCNWLNTGIDFLGINLAARTCGLISIPNP